MYDHGEAVCVIGAGASGLTAIKNLRQAGFKVDCYERETGVGGAWNWRHDRSPVYAGTHLISSKPFTQYPDFPMPDRWPDYPHHAQLLTYFERYADHFGLRDQIWFGTEVTRVEPVPSGDETTPPKWDVTVRGSGDGSSRTLRYAAVVVANGHNWSPRLPSYEGQEEFRGEIIHASGYSDAKQLRGRRVLVVGAGNTGCDIAVEAAQHAAQCWHSARRGYWYAPKYALGRPTDQLNDLVRWLRLPLWLRQWMFQRILRLTVGDLTRFGLAAPDHRVYETHPVVNSQLVYYLGHGRITAVGDVARFTGRAVELVDGRQLEPDLVIMATGYQPTIEFLNPDLLNPDSDGRPRLRLQMLAPGHPTLAVAGLVQADSGLFPIVHWQSVAIARWLRLLETAPEQAARFWSRDEPGRRFTKARLKESTRHWFELDHVVYLRALQRTLDALQAAS